MPPAGIDHIHEVYPRVCGGTPLRKWALAFYLGLSPRVRGNLALP